jgi:tRNA(fMet)-specific endonuclease VapC
MVKAELWYGALKSARPKEGLSLVKRFLAPFEIIPYDDNAAEHYGAIRLDLEQRGQRIGYNDLVIAATVMANGGILATGNSKEFKRIPGLRLETWLEFDATQ